MKIWRSVYKSCQDWFSTQFSLRARAHPLKLILAAVTPRRTRAKNRAAETLTQDYLDRCARMQPTESALYESEAALLEAATRSTGRSALVLFDSRGDSITSEEFAAWLGRLRDDGAQRVLFAIGPADGWSATARAAATRTFSFGRMTMPHELARTVMAEQVYRALTILAGHPYHGGH